MAAGENWYVATADIPNFLRELAAAIEEGGAKPEMAAVVYGTYGAPIKVVSAGNNGSIETVGLLRMAEHVMMTTMMPAGGHACEEF